jgi:hypothetical protein
MNVGRAKITGTPPLFGQILREQGKVTQEALDEALRIQATERKYIGQILCEMGQLTPAEIEEALSIQEAYGLR